MAKLIPEEQLPEELTAMAAVEAAYPAELSRAVEALVRGLPVLLECDKGMVGFFYSCLRGRLRQQQIRCTYIDGRAAPQPGQMPMGLVQTMIGQLRDAVRGGVQGDNEQRHVMVLPHLDLLTTSSGGLTSEAREVVALLYENPNILWLGFRDPSFPLPKVISNLFQHRIGIIGISRERLQHVVTRRESRKLGRGGLDLYKLYKVVSGVHVIRLRQLLASLQGEDYPDDASKVWAQIRQATLEGELQVPELDFSNTSLMFSPSYQLTDEVSVYARYAEGFRSGGYDGHAATPAAARVPYDSEELKSYELGMKSTWMDRRLLLNVAMFRIDVDDMQLTTPISTGTSTSSATSCCGTGT